MHGVLRRPVAWLRIAWEIACTEGKVKAWLGGYGQRHTDSLWQQVTLSTTGTAITLEFFPHISTEEQALKEFDHRPSRRRVGKLAVVRRHRLGGLLHEYELAA